MISASCLFRVKVWLALAAVLGTLPHQVSADSEARHKLAGSIFSAHETRELAVLPLVRSLDGKMCS